MKVDTYTALDISSYSVRFIYALYIIEGGTLWVPKREWEAQLSAPSFIISVTVSGLVCIVNTVRRWFALLCMQLA